MGISEGLTAIATAVIALATIVYAIFTVKLWRATIKTACRTEDLVKESRDQFKLHVLATYVQGRCAALALSDHDGRYEARSGYEVILLKRLLRETFPEQWEAIEQLEQGIANDPDFRKLR